MKSNKMNSKNKKRTVNFKKMLAVLFVCLIILLVFFINKKANKNNKFEITPEIARSREYEVVKSGDEKTDSDYVLFDAFFLKDLDGDGNADAIRGTCNEVGKQDTLYMDLKVINNGHFKDGVITINSSNFNLATTLVKDQIIAQNYISENTKTIKLKDIQNGNQKLITGIVNTALNNNINNYTKVNSITLTGTHVDDNGHETPINKTINFTVDWYGTATAKIFAKNIIQNVDSMDQLLVGENVKLDFELQTHEIDKKLILKSSNIEGIIPELNGYRPTSVKITGDNITYEYDQETGHFTAKREAKLDENGVVINAASTGDNDNIYKVNVVYPKASYDNMTEDVIELLIPTKTYYEGYNNQNSQFQNPYISNTAESTIVARWTKTEGYEYRFIAEIGKRSSDPYYRYYISKEKPLKIYNGISEEEKDDYYTVLWKLERGNQGEGEGIIMKETEQGNPQVSDNFIKTDSNLKSMENLTSNIGIYFAGATSSLGESGWIKVYNDETDELLETFTNENWDNYNNSKPYYYKTSVKHIRVETCKTNKNSSLNVFNIKELDDKSIIENIEKDEFTGLQYIRTTLAGYYGANLSRITNTAHYEAPISAASINISKDKITTQETTKNQIITISINEGANTQKWKNGTFLVKIPSEIIDMSINSVTVDNNEVSILGYDLYEEDDGYFIKILTENEKTQKYNISIDCDMSPDPRNTTVTKNLELYAINEDAANYYYRGKDKYDIDGDLNLDEYVNYITTPISVISPNELLTNQIACDYDDKNSITISPRVAMVEKDQRTATIELNMTNNYAQEVTDVVLQGVIPFEGNQFIVGNQALGSTYSTWMSDAGITIPNELKQYATVYYSTEAKPTNDLTNEANKWKKAEEVTNWNDIKTYIIDLGEYKLKKGESHKFAYEVNIPEGIKYNDVTYSEHGIYFAILTDAGKYSTFTAANKLGLMIAKQFDLNIEKLQERTDKKIQGVTFKITEEGQEESRIKVTDNDGRLTVQGLLVEKNYIIKELKTSEDYVLNNEEIKIYTYTDENDGLHLAYKNEDGSYSNLEEKYEWLKSAEVTKEQNENYKINISLENKVKSRLKIIKVDSTTGEKQKNVSFNIEGKDTNYVLLTDSNGEINKKGLDLNEEYTITEKSNKGYFLLDPIKLKITENNGTYSLQIIEGNVKESDVNVVDSIPEIYLTLENEKIPTYSMQIIKIEENNENKKLANAEFNFKGEDDNIQKKYTTNEDGVILVDNLYQFVNGKQITGKYTLKETKAPNGYVENTEEINFVVTKNRENLEINIENKDNLTSVVKTEVDGNTIKLTLQDKPLFKLVKKDRNSGNPLANAKFVIYEMDDAGNEIDFAKDVNGNYVGTLNNDNKYELVTDENGVITIPLRNGTYKTVEIEAPEGFDNTKYDEIFKITSNEEYKAQIEKETTETIEINYIEDLLDLSNNVKGGNNYSSTKFVLTKNLDFKDETSYKNASDATTYGDYNGDGTTETIIQELSKGTGFLPIGNSSKPFKGAFDGQNYEIKNLYINTNKSDAGLFGYVNDGEIKNIIVSGKIYSTTNNIGGIIGSINNTCSIENCKSNVDIEGKAEIGGIVGKISESTDIKNCTNTGKINGISSIGGILGSSTAFSSLTFGSWKISNCYNEGEITGATYVGGISGYSSGHLKAMSCCNYGDIYVIPDSGRSNTASSIGGIAGKMYYKSTFYDCYNFGNVTKKDNNLEYGNITYLGGIVGEADATSNISYCGNNGNIIALNATYLGGIAGGSLNVTSSFSNCYNNGDLYGKKYIGGITASYRTIRDAINTGDIIFTEPSYIGGLNVYGYVENSGLGILNNVINTGTLYYSGSNYSYNYVHSLGELNTNNIYYLDKTIEKLTNFTETTGVSKTQQELELRDFYDTLNVNNAWIYKEGNIPTLKMPTTSARAIQELQINNEQKEFKITTAIQETNGVKGGTISGEGEYPYESVDYNKNSTKEIKIVPDEGYKIVRITINNEGHIFNPKSDGTYTLPQFENMSEDKHIVVTFEKEENIVTINKIDKDTGEHLSGAEFKIGKKVDNIANQLSRANQYYFPYNEETKQYISDNKENENTFAFSYIYLNFPKNGKYHIEVNASISSEEGKDFGYATISTNGPSNAHNGNNIVSEFMNISGEVGSKTYKSSTFEYTGTGAFFVNILYNKDSENNVGEDALFINSIKLYDESNKTIIDVTDENGQIKAILEDGEYEITETKAPEGYILNPEPIEYTYSSTGEHTITIENSKKPIIKVNHYLWNQETGITETKVADSEEYKGDLGKDYSTSPNFKIEYEIVRNKDFYKGKTESEILSLLKVSTIQEAGYGSWDEFENDYYIPTNASGIYSESTEVIDYYYKEKTYTLTVKHLLEGTEQNVPSKTGGVVENTLEEGYKKDEAYTTHNSDDVDYTKYELIETPVNASGTIVEDTEVRYYYRLKDSAGVIVHHYVVGTENKVPSNSDGVVEDENLPQNGTAKVGDDYETSNASSRIAQNYRLATNKDVYGNNMPQELVGKENEVYNPTNATGKYKEDVQEVTYYYILETPIHTSSITKTGTESISKEDEKVNYNITYNVQIQDYKGNATVQIVDNLPYKIDVSKSSLNGGEYNEQNQTITWKELRNIDTYLNSSSGNITITKSISVVYSNIDYSKHQMTNMVSGNTILIESNTSTDTVQDTANTNYRFLKNITVNKVWSDNNNELALRPEKVKVTLKAGNFEIPNTIEKQVELKENSNWTYTWQNLEKYNEAGEEIEYSVEEELEGNTSIVYEPTVTESNNVYTITNTYKAPTQKIDLQVNKVWEDNNNSNKKRPERIKFEVYKKGEGETKTKQGEYILNTESETSYTFTNLLKYDAKGNKITYQVEEKEVNEDDLYFYQIAVGNVEEKTETKYEVNVTNTFKVPDEKTNIVVNKVWNDNNDENKKRPNNIKIVVSKPKETSNELEKVDEYTLKVSENESSYTFQNLAKYNLEGNEISYIVSEEEETANDLKFYTRKVEETTKYNYTITNTFTVPSEQVTIKAKKIWDDNENKANKRPSAVTIKLMNGTQEVMTDVANNSNQWEVTFSNLAKYDSHGKEIEYTVKEQEVAQNDLYFYSEGEVTGNKEEGFEIKNTFNVPDEKIQIPVTKTWNDNNQNRLSSIKLELKGNGKTYSQTLTSINKLETDQNVWKYIFTNLPKYDSNGDEITYTLSEKEVATGDLNKYIQTTQDLNVTNTLIVKDTTIEKTGTEKITTLEDKINYTLKYTVDIDSNYTQGATITIVDNLPYEIDTGKEYNLDGGTYDSTNKTITWTSNYNGEKVITKNVSLVYKNIDITKTKITNNVKGTIELTNGYKEEKTSTCDTEVDFTKTITVNKVWQGDFKTNTSGNIEISNTRPNKAKIELNSVDENNNVTKLQEKDVTQNENWQTTFENLPKYDEITRKEIKYVVTENDVPEGYYSNIKQENDLFTITNSKYGSINITKVDSVDNTKKLGGAEFKLEKLKLVNGKQEVDESFKARTATSSTLEENKGQFEFKNLEYGTYRLTETKAPEGYNLLRASTDIEINSEKVEYVGELSNKEKTALPITGGAGKSTLIIAGTFVLILLIMIKKKRIYVVRK